MTNECGQEAEQRSGYGDKQVVDRWSESSSLCVRENIIFDAFVDFDVNKDLTFKAKDKDQTPKDKDQTFKAKDQDKD